MKELWKPVIGFEGLYEVSNLGRIKSLPRNGTRVKIPHILKQKECKYKHGNHKWFSISLNKDDKRTSHIVHRLVAKAFISNPENKPCVNHVDGNPLNNQVDNLEWCTYSENMAHAFRTGLHSLKGDRHNNRKLNSSDVVAIRALKGQMYHKDIAEKYNVSRALITRILNNKNWVSI